MWPPIVSMPSRRLRLQGSWGIHNELNSVQKELRAACSKPPSFLSTTPQA